MSTIKTNKIQTLGGFTYNVPVQVVTSSLGVGDLGTTDTATSDRTNANPAWAITTTTTTWTDTTNLQLTITPKFSNSIIKLDLNVYMGCETANHGPAVRIKRGNKIIWRPTHDNTGPFGTGFSTASSLHSVLSAVAFDSPATTSPVTYSLQYRSYNGGTCRIFAYGAATGYGSSNYLIATEIAQ